MADGNIGSVGVSVVPDARDFWRRFEEQTRAGAAEAGRRAGNDWRRGFDTAAEGGRPVVVPVRTDTSRVRADLTGLRAQLANIGNARIDTGSLTAANLASITAATHRLADAQDKVKKARAELEVVSKKEGHTEEELAVAAAAVARAQRDQELAALRLAAAEESVAAAQDRSRKAAEKEAAALAAKSAATSDAKDKNVSLIGSLLALAPAVVPLAAAAGLGGAALGSMAIQGVLAVKGIKTEIKAASAEGLKFSAGLNVLKGDLGTLENTAAHNVLGAFQQATAKLHADLPAVNADLAQSSKVLGDIGGHLLGAVVGGEHTFAPALLAVEQQVDKLAARFEAWATGPGGEKFASALAQDFARVEPFIEHVVGALGHLVAASNGPGLAIITELDTFAKVLDKIPTPVLTTLVTGIVALRVASTVTGLMDKLALSIRGVAVAQGEATAATRLRGGLASSIGFVGKLGATYLAVALGANELKNATDGWMYSLNSTKRVVGETANAVGDLFTGHIGNFVKDLTSGHQAVLSAAADNETLAASYYSIIKAPIPWKGAILQTSVLNQKQIDLMKTLTEGHVVYGQYTGAQALANEQAKDLAANESNLAAILAQVHGRIGGGGGISQLAGQYTQAQGALQGNIDATSKFLKLGGETLDTYHGVTIGLKTYQAALEQTGSATAAIGYIHAQIDALGANQSALAKLSVEQQNVSTYLSDVTTKYHITSEQVDAYTAALGINVSAIEAGGAGMKAAEVELGKFVHQLENGTTATDAWVAAVAQFQQGADTAASRAALMGAAFKAAQGDTLDYATTMVTAAQANQQLVTDFQHLKSGVLDLKTGTLDYHNAAAAPLINDLDRLQTAAIGAATATYQHELATKGSKRAADDAFLVYKNDTRGALIDQAKKLHLTRDEAKKVADQYFGIKNSGDLKKKIELLGGDKVAAFLKGILQDLDIMAGKTTVLSVEIQGHNAANVASGAGVGTGSHGKTLIRAAGGFISGSGTGTSDSIPARLSNGEFVVNAKQTAKHRGLLHALNDGVQGFAGGGEAGGFTGVDASGNANKNGVVKNSAASNALASLLSAAQSLAASAASSSSTASDIQSASQSLNDAAKSAKVSQGERAYLTAREASLTALARQRDALDARLGSAPTPPTAYDRLGTAQQNLADERSNVRGAFTGTFNIAQAGQNQFNEPVSFGAINRELMKAVANASAFNSALHRLAKEGLNKTLLQQLAEAGPSALPQARALLGATPKQLAALNREYRSLNKSSASAGSFIARDLYQAGVDSAEGLVRGLQSKRSRLNQEMRSIGQGMAAELRSSLGIHSPSRVMHEIGLFTGEGLRTGLAAKHAAIRAEAVRMGNAAVPAGVRALQAAGVSRGGGQHVEKQELHVHYPLESDLRQALKDLTRMNARQLREAGEALGR